jgi:hypothetical protein
MANTYTLIASSTVGAGGAASIDFSSIPATYTDLIVKVSARNDTASIQNLNMKFNGSTSSLSMKYLDGAGSGTPTSGSATVGNIGGNFGTGATANTFSNTEVYIPNYAGSNYKSYSADAVTETNATTAYMDLCAGLWSNTAAINQVTVFSQSGNLVQYSTAYLYGVNNA